MNFITKLFISAIAVIITAYFLDGVTLGDNQFYHDGPPALNRFTTALLVAIVLAFLNSMVLNFEYAFTKLGLSFRHGPHQLAQNLSTQKILLDYITTKYYHLDLQFVC